MCSVFSDALILVSSFFFQFDHKNTHTNIYECKKRSNYCISVSQKKKNKIGCKWALFIKCDCP